MGVAPPGETGFACAENGKEGREEGRAHGKVHKEQLTVKYGRLWDFILYTLSRALEIRPFALKATPYEVCAGLIPILHLVKLRHRYITYLGFPISKWQGQDLNLGTLRTWDLTIALCCPSLCQCHFHILVEMEDSESFSSQLLYSTILPIVLVTQAHCLQLLFLSCSISSSGPQVLLILQDCPPITELPPGDAVHRLPAQLPAVVPPLQLFPFLFISFVKLTNAPLSSFRCPAYKPPKPPHIDFTNNTGTQQSPGPQSEFVCNFDSEAVLLLFQNPPYEHSL